MTKGKKKTKVPGEYEVSMNVEPSTSIAAPTGESNLDDYMFENRRDMIQPEEAQPVAFSTPIRPTSKDVEFGNFNNVNVSQETRERLDKQGTTHWKSTMLTDIQGPLHNLSQDPDNYMDGDINLIACRSMSNLSRIGNHAGTLIGRVMRAIELGARYTGRKIRSAPEDKTHLTRKEERITFKNTLQTLDEMLREVVKYNDDKLVGYRIEKETWDKFNEELKDLRREALDDLCQAQSNIPTLPIWGKGEDIQYFWNENDFEVLGACYRIEVEGFLATLSKHHEFGETNKERERIETIPEEAVEDGSKKNQEASIIRVAKDRQEFEKERGYGKKNSSPEEESISRVTKPNIIKRGRIWGNPVISTFGHPTDNNNGRRMKEIFSESISSASNNARTSRQNTRTNNDQNRRRDDDSRGIDKNSEKPKRVPDSGPPDDDDDGDDDDHRGRRNPQMPKAKKNDSSENKSEVQTVVNSPLVSLEPQFDNRLKADSIPTWDGNPDTLGRWVLKINRLADRSETMHRQLGYLVPSRLTGAAETWYYSQSLDTRMTIERNWTDLRDCIGTYYMNRAFMNRQKSRANNAAYRDSENPKESPSEYFIRKVELLGLVYEYNDVELINEIMNGAPAYWTSVLTPHLYQNLEDFQLALKFHEDSLNRMDANRTRPFYQNNPRNPFNQYRNTRTNLVGWSKDTINPPFPKDDSNISPKATPESKGARPCRHCGSGKHWDPECKYARKGEKRARVNNIEVSPEDREALNEYESLYFEEVSDSEDESKDF